VVLLDVRQPGEVAEASVSDAGGRKVLYVPVTLDDSSAMSEAFLASHQLAKDQALVVFCRSGRRAGVAKAALEALGCTAVTNGGTVDDVKAALLAGTFKTLKLEANA
jgi:phage shock protein E